MSSKLKSKLPVEQPRFVRSEFVERMESELQANAHKGDWRAWKPTALQALSELQHHEAKLMQALAADDCEHIREFCADIANITMKIDEQFGVKNESGEDAESLSSEPQQVTGPSCPICTGNHTIGDEIGILCFDCNHSFIYEDDAEKEQVIRPQDSEPAPC